MTERMLSAAVRLLTLALRWRGEGEAEAEETGRPSSAMRECGRRASAEVWRGAVFRPQL